MQGKDTIYDKEQACSEIGQSLHDAKRRMLDAFKKGVSLNAAAKTFMAETSNVINRAEAKLGTTIQSADTKPAEPSDNRETDNTATFETDAAPLYLSADDFSLQQQRIETYLEDSIFVEGISTAKRQQKALIKLLDTLANTPRNDLHTLIVFARDFAIRHSPDLTEVIAAKLCDRQIEVCSDDDGEQTEDAPPPSEHPYDVSPETIAQFMAENPKWENRLLRLRAKFNGPVDKLKRARDGAIIAAGTINEMIEDQKAAASNKPDVIDFPAVEREIDNAKGALMNDLAGGVKPELAYLRFAIKINERVGGEQLYPKDEAPVANEQGARTIIVAREIAADERYHERTRKLLAHEVDLENFDGNDIARAHLFIGQVEEMDRIFRTCETLTARELDGAADYIIAQEANSAIAAVTFLLDHMATLAANGKLKDVIRFATEMQDRLFGRDRNAFRNHSMETWRKAGRKGITEYATAITERESEAANATD